MLCPSERIQHACRKVTETPAVSLSYAIETQPYITLELRHVEINISSRARLRLVQLALPKRLLIF